MIAISSSLVVLLHKGFTGRELGGHTHKQIRNRGSYKHACRTYFRSFIVLFLSASGSNYFLLSRSCRDCHEGCRAVCHVSGHCPVIKDSVHIFSMSFSIDCRSCFKKHACTRLRAVFWVAVLVVMPAMTSEEMWPRVILILMSFAGFQTTANYQATRPQLGALGLDEDDGFVAGRFTLYLRDVLALAATSKHVLNTFFESGSHFKQCMTVWMAATRSFIPRQIQFNRDQTDFMMHIQLMFNNMLQDHGRLQRCVDLLQVEVGQNDVDIYQNDLNTSISLKTLAAHGSANTQAIIETQKAVAEQFQEQNAAIKFNKDLMQAGLHLEACNRVAIEGLMTREQIQRNDINNMIVKGGVMQDNIIDLSKAHEENKKLFEDKISDVALRDERYYRKSEKKWDAMSQKIEDQTTQIQVLTTQNQALTTQNQAQTTEIQALKQALDNDRSMMHATFNDIYTQLNALKHPRVFYNMVDATTGMAASSSWQEAFPATVIAPLQPAVHVSSEEPSMTDSDSSL